MLDLELFGLVCTGGDEREIAAALVFEFREHFQLIFLAVFVGDGDEVVSEFLVRDVIPSVCLCSYFTLWRMQNQEEIMR